MTFQSCILTTIIIFGASSAALGESDATLPIESLNAATQKLQDVYKRPEYSAVPSSLERFHFNLLRMMVFDPDRGDPWDSRKSEKAWQMTERSSQEWLEVLPTLTFCPQSAEAVKKFGDVVREIHDFRRKLYYRASRGLVKSGRLDEAYQKLTDSLSRCAKPTDDEMELVFSAQRRFRFQKLGLAIDDFYRQYWQKYPEDRHLINSPILAQEKAQTQPAPTPPQPIMENQKPRGLPWLPILATLNFLGILSLFLYIRLALRQTITPTPAPHEPTMEHQPMLQQLQAVFTEIFESEEFLQLIVEEAQSIEAAKRSDYIRVLTGHIESIHRILNNNEAISSILAQLTEAQKALQIASESTSAPRAFAALLRIISEYQDRLKPLAAA